MSERIDVLGVMDAVIEGMGGPTDLGLSEARAAVAELVEADRECDEASRQWQRVCGAGLDPDEPARQRAFSSYTRAKSRRRAALARIAPNELHDKAAELRGRGE